MMTSRNSISIDKDQMNNLSIKTRVLLFVLFFPVIAFATEPSATPQPFQGKPSILPGMFEAEHFDDGPADVAYRDLDPKNQGADYRKATAVDIEKRPDASNGHGLGWTKAGEWLMYSVDVSQSGTYALAVPVACDGTGGQFHFEIDGKPITKKLQIPDTGGWDKLKTIRQDGIQLTSGQHKLKLVMDSNGDKGSTGDIDKFVFELNGGS